MTLRSKLGISQLVAGVSASVVLVLAPIHGEGLVVNGTLVYFTRGNAIAFNDLPLMLLAIGVLVCTMVGTYSIIKGVRSRILTAIVMSLFVIAYALTVPRIWGLIILPMFSLLVIAATRLDKDKKFFDYDVSDIA